MKARWKSTFARFQFIPTHSQYSNASGQEQAGYALHFNETITPRRFRTTVATDISAETHDLKLVQRMLGHSTPQMTLKHYDKGRSTATDAAQAISKCYGFDRLTDGEADAHIM